MGDSTVSKCLVAPLDPWRWPLRGIFVLLLAALVAYGFRCVERGRYEPPDPARSPEALRKREHRGCDFTAFYSAGEVARKGLNIYEDWRTSSTPYRPFIYPPMFALFPMAPLSLLSHNAALAAFFALKAVLLLAALWMLGQVFWGEAQRAFWPCQGVGLFLAVLCCGRFFDADFGANNANVIILFLLVLSLFLLTRNMRATGGLSGGLTLALATVYKLTPGLLGLYFLWSRRGWAMAGGALGLALFLVVIPSLSLGFESNRSALRAFYAYASGQVENASTNGGAASASAYAEDADTTVGWGAETTAQSGPPRAFGISLRGTFQKLFSQSVALNHARPGAEATVNVLDLSPQAARQCAGIMSLALLALAIFLTAQRSARATPQGTALSWALLVVTILLIAPLTRKAHGVVLIIPVAALIASLQLDRHGGLTRTLAWGALFVLFGAGTFTSSDFFRIFLPGAEAKSISNYFHAIGCFTFAMLGVYAACALALWSHIEEAQPAAGPAVQPGAIPSVAVVAP